MKCLRKKNKKLKEIANLGEKSCSGYHQNSNLQTHSESEKFKIIKLYKLQE